MATFQEFMTVGLEMCAPRGEGSQQARRETFSDLADLWNREKETIQGMTKAEIRRNLRCP